MKNYQTCLALLLLVGSITGCSDNAPVDVHITQQERKQFFEGDNPFMTYVVITANADQVTVKNAKINRGNGCGTARWTGSGNLKYGQSLKGLNLCQPDQIKEVTVETDQGDYTFNF